MAEPEKGSSLDRDAVAARAYALYVRRGMKPGRDLDDWLEAERQLRDETLRDAVAKAPAPLVPPPPPAPASPAEPPAAGTPAKRRSKKPRR
jgi:hypothetical protein